MYRSKERKTRKWLRENYKNIIMVENEGVHYLMHGNDPWYYCTRAEGWACDLYALDEDTLICCGYAPFGNKDFCYKEITKEFENKAKEIFYAHLPWAEEQIKLDALREEFRKVVLAC